MTSPATLRMWFALRSPELAEDFERLIADRDIVRRSLEPGSDWRLRRVTDGPLEWRARRSTDVRGQVIDEADYVRIAEIADVELRVQQLAEDLDHLVVLTRFEIR